MILYFCVHQVGPLYDKIDTVHENWKQFVCLNMATKLATTLVQNWLQNWKHKTGSKNDKEIRVILYTHSDPFFGKATENGSRVFSRRESDVWGYD